MRNKIYIVTQARLASALADVRAELRKAGIWSTQLAQVPVKLSRLNPLGLHCYGWKWTSTQGPIMIPMICVPRIIHCIGWQPYVSLRDVLRHEYAHALADCHPKIVRSRHFVRAFGGRYTDCRGPCEYDPEVHVSPYAASCPAEDFAETFMVWLRSRSACSRLRKHRFGGARLGFVESLAKRRRFGLHPDSCRTHAGKWSRTSAGRDPA